MKVEHGEFSERHNNKHDIELSLHHDFAMDGVIEVTCNNCNFYAVLNLWQDNDEVIIEEEGDCWKDEEEE